MTVERATEILATENQRHRKDSKEVIEARQMGIKALKLQMIAYIWLGIGEPSKEGRKENEVD